MKWFFSRRFKFYPAFLYYHRFIDVWFVIDLLRCDVFCHLVRRFISVEAIHTGKADLSSLRYQIIMLSMFKNWSLRYSSHYIIKFIGFISIYYAINLNIFSSYMIFNYLYLESIDILQI